MFLKSKKVLSNNEKDVKHQQAITSKVLKSANVLIKAIMEESELIKSGKLIGLKDRLQNKIDRHNVFVSYQEELSNYALEHGLDKSDKNIQFLKEAMYSLDVENKKNELLVKIAMETSERIVNAYKEAQTKASARHSGYNKEGKIAGEKSAKKSAPASSLNNKF